MNPAHAKWIIGGLSGVVISLLVYNVHLFEKRQDTQELLIENLSRSAAIRFEKITVLETNYNHILAQLTYISKRLEEIKR